MSSLDTNLVSLSTERLGDLHEILNRLGENAQVEAAVRSLRDRSGPGREMLGWLDLPHRRGPELDRQKDHAARLREEIDTLVVIGIGGSYLGTRAVAEALEGGGPAAGTPRLLFAGHHLEAHVYSSLLEEIERGEVALNVISKSGTTTEPAVAFRLLRKQLEERYGSKKARQRIVVTTDARAGALRTLADEEGYLSFSVPDDVGGRFSVLSPVGLFPLAVAGVDVDALLDGAAAEARRCLEGEWAELPSVRYGAARHLLYLQGIVIEVLASFHPSLHHLAEWWKQLFGESEGKAGRGLWPASVDFTTDLHSLGQYLQQGRRILSETFLDVQTPPPGPVVPSDPRDLDGLEFLAGRPVSAINLEALDAVADAHLDGQVPSMTLQLPGLNEHALGSLLFHFEFAVAISGRLLDVNPFDQPGVEAYKRNLFRALGKPGAS